jgi:hypothetical protein
MRMTPAQRHFARKSGMAAAIAIGAAALGGAATDDDNRPSPYRLQLAELGECLRELKQIQAREGKIARKRELIARFDAWVAGVLDAHRAGGPAVQDDVVLTMMVWALDIEDHERALDLIAYVVGNDLVMPERYTRTAPTIVAEIAADNALAALGRGEQPDLTFLQLVEEATREKDMIDQVRAKLHKAIGLTMIFEPSDDAEPERERAGGWRAALAAAIPQLKRALQLHDKVGVKKDIEKAERELAKLKET